MAWRTIESAPKDGTPVLLYVPTVESWNRFDSAPPMTIGAWLLSWTGRGRWLSDIGEIDPGYPSTGACFVHEELNPTHWMPLPTPPADWIPKGHVVVEGMEEK